MLGPLVGYFSLIKRNMTDINFVMSGPLIVIALLYEALGMAMAFVIKQFFWVPHRFRYGILVAGGWGNVGDIRELFHITFSDILTDNMSSDCRNHEHNRSSSLPRDSGSKPRRCLYLCFHTGLFGIFALHPIRFQINNFRSR